MSKIKPKILSIFDWDQTLFKSPYPPEHLSHYYWWNSPKSLTPPAIPLTPEFDWFREEVVTEFQKSIEDPNQYVVVCTGRIEALRPYVEYLVHLVGKPDEIHLNNVPPLHANTPEEKLTTENYKIKTMFDILKENPAIETIHFWDDRHKSLIKYEKVARMNGYSFYPHHIEEDRRYPLALEEE